MLPTRLTGRRGGAKIEATLHKDLGQGRWRAFVRPAKKLKAGDAIDFAEDFSALVTDKHEGGEVTLAFAQSGPALMAELERYGAMPLPPYIRRNGAATAEDRAGDRAEDRAEDRLDYQTIFAEVEGAVAAPTAGLHFTERLLAALDRRGIERVTVTLHVGAGTFLPVKSDQAEDHVMHAEHGVLSAAAVAKIEAARAAGGRIVAVGTTALRLLESVAQESSAQETGRLAPFDGETKLFILPGYRFRVVDLLLTNFHLPRSTLLMLVAAFAGTGRIKAAYRHALEAGYRFYSYGDACLLEREDRL